MFYECRNAPLTFAKQNWNRPAAARNVFTGVGTRHCYSQNIIRTVQSWHNFYECRCRILGDPRYGWKCSIFKEKHSLDSHWFSEQNIFEVFLRICIDFPNKCLFQKLSKYNFVREINANPKKIFKTDFVRKINENLCWFCYKKSNILGSTLDPDNDVYNS